MASALGITAFLGGFIAAVVVPGALNGHPSASGPGPDCATDSLVGTVSVKLVTVRADPSPSSRAIESFGRMAPYGVRQVFALQSQVAGSDGRQWYRASLPVPPNGSTGFIPARGVALSTSPYRLVVDRDGRMLTVYRHCRRIGEYRVAVGKPSTPTPLGQFYLTGLFKPDQNSALGPYAYSLSAHSEVLTWWKFGGIVGLHGTNDPSSIGRPVTHGCLRVRNEVMERLARMLPVGTPIEVR